MSLVEQHRKFLDAAIQEYSNLILKGIKDHSEYIRMCAKLSALEFVKEKFDVLVANHQLDEDEE